VSDRLRRLAFRASELLGLYRAFQVESDEDRAAVLAVVDAVRRVELKRAGGGAALESSAFAGTAVESDLLAVRETRTGRIVGAARGVPAAQLASVSESRVEYALDLLPPEILARAAVATRLVVLPEYRRSPAAFALLQYMYEEGTRRGYELCLLACEPGLYRLYLRIGFRPLGRPHASPTGGFRIPMVLVSRDAEHLEAVGSPLLRSLNRIGRVADAPGVRWYRHLVAERGQIDPGIAFYYEDGDDTDVDDNDEAVHRVLTDGLSNEGRSALLDGAVSLGCDVGDVVLRAGDGGRQMGFVLEGMLTVERDGRTLAVLGPGELFGELATVLDAVRTARVVAATPGTRLLLLSQRAPERVRGAQDREILWRNLARILGTRLAGAPPAVSGDPPS